MYNPSKPYKHEILNLIKSTWSTPYVTIKAGTYPLIKKHFSFTEVQHTDGIGTKGVYHWKKRSFRSAVIDSLAMNLNDLALVGAVPYAIQNHIILPQEDRKAILSILSELAEECAKRNIAITGGETSIHEDALGLDISITISGFIKKVRRNQFRNGDILIGIKSNGLHANGFTKVRELFGSQIRPEFTQPTVIYYDAILGLLSRYEIHGMMNITGGAFTKLKDLLQKSSAYITRNHKLHPQKIFIQMHSKGIPNKVMYSTFNCGIGFVLSASPKEAKRIASSLKDADIIGKVIPGNGKIEIESVFDNSTVRL